MDFEEKREEPEVVKIASVSTVRKQEMKRKHLMAAAMNKFLLRKEREYEEEQQKEKRQKVGKLSASTFEKKL